MSSYFEIINNSDDFPGNVKYYWGYQYRLGKEILVEFLKKQNCFKPGFKVAEIGSAEGGVLASFVEAGAAEALGTDILQARLDLGKQIAELCNLKIEFSNHNIITNEPIDEWKDKFDLVILRDVIEHLDDTEIALKNIKKIIKPGGFLYVTFPPYYSAFGAHQHTALIKAGKIPFIHWLPKALFFRILKKCNPLDKAEIVRLNNIRLTPGKFIKAAKLCDYEIFRKDFFLIRPVYRMKFGLPSVKVSSISFLPFVKGVFSTEASYILKKSEE